MRLCRAPGAAHAPANQSPWESSAALGFTLTRGNRSTLLFPGNLHSSRKQGNNDLQSVTAIAYKF